MQQNIIIELHWTTNNLIAHSDSIFPRSTLLAQILEQFMQVTRSDHKIISWLDARLAVKKRIREYLLRILVNLHGPTRWSAGWWIWQQSNTITSSPKTDIYEKLVCATCFTDGVSQKCSWAFSRFSWPFYSTAFTPPRTSCPPHVDRK